MAAAAVGKAASGAARTAQGPHSCASSSRQSAASCPQCVARAAQRGAQSSLTQDGLAGAAGLPAGSAQQRLACECKLEQSTACKCRADHVRWAVVDTASCCPLSVDEHQAHSSCWVQHADAHAHLLPQVFSMEAEHGRHIRKESGFQMLPTTHPAGSPAAAA